MKDEQEQIKCMQCSYYYVTWDRKRPKGCKYFGFKSAQLPALVVAKLEGKQCNMYTPKQRT